MKGIKRRIILILWACLFALCFNANAHNEGSNILGQWKTIDFVETIADFTPGSQQWAGGELYLKNLTFLPDGETDRPWWSWANRWLIHHGDKSAGEFIIETIHGTNYMFLEWISGDVLIRKMKPKYYVLKRYEISTEKPSFKNHTAVLGSWSAVDFVDTIADFNPEVPTWQGDLYLKEFEFNSEGATHQPFWTWTKGTVHHSGDDTDAKYKIRNVKGKDYLFLQWINGDVIFWGMKPNYYVFKRNETPFSNHPAVLGAWTSVDFIETIADFDPDLPAWEGDLYLKEFEFRPEGATHTPFWTWTRNRVHHSGDDTDAKYRLRKINGEPYLFLEWMNGDVTLQGMKPYHYVFKRK